MSAGKPQLTRILRELALLPAVTDDVPLPALDARNDRVLVCPDGVRAAGRPWGQDPMPQPTELPHDFASTAKISIRKIAAPPGGQDSYPATN
ncbi:MAG TPA: hypothetical protein VHE35_09960 [Kofleriaceae bacterium]|nr:hypothetical protein [Kofleriaceae bacterium]